MNKNPFINALLAALYIAGIALLMTNITKAIPEGKSILIPMVVLSLFVLSASVMGFLFVSRPLQLYMDGNKEQVLGFFLKTVGSFAIFALLYVILLVNFGR